MKKLLFIILLFQNYQYSKANNSPLYVSNLINISELIVEGEIIEVNYNTFIINIVDLLKGKTEEKKIVITQFKNWNSAERWTKYKIGQKGLYFISKSSNGNRWEILGDGNEGEMPIEKGIVYYQSPFFGRQLLNHSFENHQLVEGKILGYKFEISEAKNGIKEYFNNEELILNKIKDRTIVDFYPENRFLNRILNEIIIRNQFTYDKLSERQEEIDKRFPNF